MSSGGEKAEQTERCVLCLDEKRSPVRITCGHSFCNECLDVYKSYQKYAWANRCPICRGSLKEKRRSVKKKSGGATSTSTNTTTTATMSSPASTATATTTASSAAAAATPHTLTTPIEQIYLLEEFMAMAADLDQNFDDLLPQEIVDDDNEAANVDDDEDDDDDEAANIDEDEDDDDEEGQDDEDDEFYSEDDQENFYYFEDGEDDIEVYNLDDDEDDYDNGDNGDDEDVNNVVAEVVEAGNQVDLAAAHSGDGVDVEGEQDVVMLDEVIIVD